MKLKSYLRLLRPSHYIKNFFVLSPLFFSLKFAEFKLLERSIFAFIVFSLIASSVYILNDIKDIDEDKEHPEKSKRPIVNGEISISSAIKVLIALACIGFTLAYLVTIKLLFIMLIYYVLNIFYNFGLKHIAIADVFIVSSGFVLRVFAGAESINVPVTMWIVLITFLLSLFLALSKRRDNIILAGEGNKIRKNIDGYNLVFVNSGMIIMSAVVIVCYILYTISDDVIKRFNTDKLYFTVLFVLLGILRYMQIIFVENNSADPIKIFLKDKLLQLIIISWLAVFLLIVY